MNRWGFVNISLLFVLLISFLAPAKLSAQSQNDDAFEVYLAFRHRGVINALVISYYLNDSFYLPVDELFSTFSVESDMSGLVITGFFGSDQIPYVVDLGARYVEFGEVRKELDQSEFMVTDLDLYLSPEVFSEIFGLNFVIDFNSLTLNLQTERELPIIERTLRRKERRVADRLFSKDFYYPLEYGRNETVIDGAFLDYSFATYVSPTISSFNYNTAIGLQMAGGDLQGTIFGNYSQNINSVQANNLRWQYVFGDNPYLTRIAIGQSNLDGVLNNQFTGIRLTNEPVEPRRFFDEFEIEGETFPQSEVELYLNNALIDYQQSDELGNYRFLTPLYYGVSQLNLRVYGPTGQVIEQQQSIQVPFNFIPAGEVNYYLNAGYVNNLAIGTVGQSFVTQANTIAGLTNWLTSRVGFEHFSAPEEEPLSVVTANTSARLFNSLILTGEMVTSAYYRASLNSVFPNAASFLIDYTDFSSNRSVYNNSGFERQIIANTFLPFRIKELPLNFRFSTFTRFRNQQYINRFRADFNTRVNKINFRLGYSDLLVDTFNPMDATPASYLETALTYNFSRNRNIPGFLAGTFVRGQMRYMPSMSRVESAEVLLARNILSNGRVQLAVGRNFFAEFNTVRLNFVIDFQKVRTNSTVTFLRNTYNMGQNVRGSVGYDTNYGNTLFSSQNQVGRSGTAIQMFVDNNNNQRYEEDIDDAIPDAQMRIDRTGSPAIYKNGVLYYTQMLPYFRYNLEMNNASIRNPMLVPELDKFSIITDPNTFKKIEVPFYMAGVMDGEVLRQFEDGQKKGIGGLKLLLSSTDNEISKELRTFSDGSFYDYPLPPGNYVIRVDPKQLDLLGSYSEPERIEFTVDAIPEGDFIEGIMFTLIPGIRPSERPQEDENISLSSLSEDVKDLPEIRNFENALATRVNDALRLLISAQEAFYDNRISRALTLVDESLGAFETAQGYALKGSLYFFRGNREEALRSWRMAVRFDPNIYIPDMEYLEKNIITSSPPEDE